MTARLTAALAAAALAVGMLIGAAGATVVGNATSDSAVARHHEHVDSTMGTTGADMRAMMEMMGGSAMSQHGPTGSGESQHDTHHRGANP